MAYTEKQNPKNKVGRNSGEGPGGVSEMIPTERELERGIEAIRLDEPRRWGRVVGFGLGAAALVGGGFAALRLRQIRRPRGLRGHVNRLLSRVRIR